MWCDWLPCEGGRVSEGDDQIIGRVHAWLQCCDDQARCQLMNSRLTSHSKRVAALSEAAEKLSLKYRSSHARDRREQRRAIKQLSLQRNYRKSMPTLESTISKLQLQASQAERAKSLLELVLRTESLETLAEELRSDADESGVGIKTMLEQQDVLDQEQLGAALQLIEARQHVQAIQENASRSRSNPADKQKALLRLAHLLFGSGLQRDRRPHSCVRTHACFSGQELVDMLVRISIRERADKKVIRLVDGEIGAGMIAEHMLQDAIIQPISFHDNAIASNTNDPKVTIASAFSSVSSSSANMKFKGDSKSMYCFASSVVQKLSQHNVIRTAFQGRVSNNHEFRGWLRLSTSSKKLIKEIRWKMAPRYCVWNQNQRTLASFSTNGRYVQGSYELDPFNDIFNVESGEEACNERGQRRFMFEAMLVDGRRLLLMTTSDQDRKDWISALRRTSCACECVNQHRQRMNLERSLSLPLLPFRKALNEHRLHQTKIAFDISVQVPDFGADAVHTESFRGPLERFASSYAKTFCHEDGDENPRQNTLQIFLQEAVHELEHFNETLHRISASSPVTPGDDEDRENESRRDVLSTNWVSQCLHEFVYDTIFHLFRKQEKRRDDELLNFIADVQGISIQELGLSLQLLESMELDVGDDKISSRSSEAMFSEAIECMSGLVRGRSWPEKLLCIRNVFDKICEAVNQAQRRPLSEMTVIETDDLILILAYVMCHTPSPTPVYAHLLYINTFLPRDEQGDDSGYQLATVETAAEVLRSGQFVPGYADTMGSLSQ